MEELKIKSDLEKIEDKMVESKEKIVSREEFESLKLIVKEIIIKLKTRNF